MGEFRLQVGDVRDWRQFGEVEAKMIKRYKGKMHVMFDGGFCEVSEFLAEAKTIHRPTPSGLVQVWPEVKGAKPTFEEALEATIDKYGDALSRLAGAEEVQP